MDLAWIRTCNVGVEGKLTDHLTTTTALPIKLWTMHGPL